MTTVPITSGNLSVVFREGELPKVPPADPCFMLALNGLEIFVRISAKSGRKLATHSGGAVLQGKLVANDAGNLALLDAGFNWLDPKPAAVPEMSSTGEPS